MADFDDPEFVSVVIHPSGGDDQPLSATDFIKQVEALRQLLALTGDQDDGETKIVKLHMNSPATVVMDPPASGKVMERFFNGLRSVALDGAAPSDFGRPVFEALKDFAAVVGKGVRSAELQFAGGTICIDAAARRRIESVFGADTVSSGSVDGMLEAINVHGKKNTFALYPIVGASRITCKFDDRLFQDVRPALGKYVIIEGELRYRWRDKFPYEAVATGLKIMDDWEDQPSFTEIIGMAPNATDGATSEEFVKSARYGW